MRSIVMDSRISPMYPCLMVSNAGQIVLMDGHKTGMALNGNAHHIGEYRTDWVMENFEPFYGSVTIEA